MTEQPASVWINEQRAEKERDRETQRAVERRREGGRARERRGKEPPSKTHTSLPLWRLPSCACFSVYEHEKKREGREENKSLYFAFPSFFISIIQSMKTGVSWHSRIRERDVWMLPLFQQGTRKRKGGTTHSRHKNRISRMNGSSSAACAGNSSLTLKSLNEVNIMIPLYLPFSSVPDWPTGSDIDLRPTWKHKHTLDRD